MELIRKAQKTPKVRGPGEKHEAVLPAILWLAFPAATGVVGSLVGAGGLYWLADLVKVDKETGKFPRRRARSEFGRGRIVASRVWGKEKQTWSGWAKMEGVHEGSSSQKGRQPAMLDGWLWAFLLREVREVVCLNMSVFFQCPLLQGERSFSRGEADCYLWGPLPAGDWTRDQLLCWNRSSKLQSKGQTIKYEQDHIAFLKCNTYCTQVNTEREWGEIRKNKLLFILPLENNWSLIQKDFLII